jgi:hypothetical protein
MSQGGCQGDQPAAGCFGPALAIASPVHVRCMSYGAAYGQFLVSDLTPDLGRGLLYAAPTGLGSVLP